MELPELSLAPSHLESKVNPSRKRKLFQDSHPMKAQSLHQTSLDLQLKDPLPLDWEQCLDLESGKMYYLNRKTSRKSWDWPMDQAVNLELNMSTTLPDSCLNRQSGHRSPKPTLGEAENKRQSWSEGSNNMVALACLNCHLLVILSKACPACPNCKYVHSLPSPSSKFQPTT